MKNLCITLLTAAVCLCSLAAGAQTNLKKIPLNQPDYNKPKLFSDLPDRVDFNPGNFSPLFDLQVGQSVNVPISPVFNFTGKVVSISDAPHANSVVIRSTNRAGARLIFTKVTDANNAVKYLGRIISLDHGDSYEIVSENNHYFFKKKSIYDLISE